MLSDENPPQVPTCATDDKVSGKLKAVDLLSSHLEKGDQPLPKFSIRDYVFCTRNKNITKNWPFSQAKLQLCMKYGVRDVLPPFQSADLVRNPGVKCKGDTIVVDKINTCHSSGKLYVPKLDKEVRSTTSVSCSNIVHTDKSCVTAEASLEVSATTLKKKERTNQPSLKKCRLIVKNNNIPSSSTKEATSLNAPMNLEAMAVCPVCRTFSSSSNTTLNAHMDQCLSGGLISKPVADSEVIKHRIKPRKMRSMVDIYKTAPHCTLEELEKRNGSNWASKGTFSASEELEKRNGSNCASNTTFSAPEVEARADQKKQNIGPNFEETRIDGSVYVDSNGTKLRILSKAMDSTPMDSPPPRKFVKKGKGSTLHLKKKKISKMKNQIQKQQKPLKLATHGKNEYGSRLHFSSKISKGQDGKILCEENDEKDECMTQQLNTSDLVKCSKKTGQMKQLNGRVDKRHSGECVDGKMHVKCKLSSLSGSHVKKISDLEPPNAISLGRNNKSSHELVDERGCPLLRNRTGSLMETGQERKGSLVFHELAERGVKHSRKNGSLDDEENEFSLSKRWVEIRKGHVRRVDSAVAKQKSSSTHHGVSSGAGKFSSLKKKLLSPSYASAPVSKLPLKRKASSIKSCRVFQASKPDEDNVQAQAGTYQSQEFPHESSEEHATTEDTSSHEFFDRNVVVKVRSSREHMVSRKKAMHSKSSHSTSIPCYNDQDAREGNDSLVFDVIDRHASESTYSSRTKDNQNQASQLLAEEKAMRFNNLREPGFHDLPALSKAQCHSRRFIEEYKMSLYDAEDTFKSTEPILSPRQDSFFANVIPENMTVGNVCLTVGGDSSEGHGSYLAEVDQILIPGPPGSFLPSPRRMDSDDLQGNSSLTSIRVQSHDNQRGLLADRSSVSPASATSTISNSNIARPDYCDKFSVGPPAEDVEMFGSTIAANRDPVVKLNKIGTEIPGHNESMTNLSVPDKGHFGYRNDPACCCSRKDGLLQNIALNHHESPLLQRRTKGILMSCGLNETFDNAKSSSSVGLSVDGTESVAGLVSSSVSSGIGKFHADRESVSPTTSNPVLRLMGKNLFVNKKDENLHPQHGQPAVSNSMTGHENLHAVSGVHAENTQHAEYHRVPHMASQVSGFYNHAEPSSARLRHLNWGLSEGFGNHGNSGAFISTSAISSLAMPVNHTAPRDFTPPVRHHEYSGSHGFPTQQFRPINKLATSFTQHKEKVIEYPHVLYKKVGSVAKTDKEIIVLNDIPENEVNATTAARHNQVMGVIRGESAVYSAGSAGCLSMSSEPQSASPFCNTQQYVYGRPVISLVDSSFLMPPSSGANSELVKMKRGLGSNMLHGTSSNTGAFPGVRLTSELYNPSGF